MSETRATRIVFADQLMAGDVICDPYPKPHALVVLTIRVSDDTVTGIGVDEDGEQQEISYLKNVTVRILVRDIAPAATTMETQP